METRRHRRRRRPWQTFRLPVSIAILSFTGLVWALVADGPTDFVATALVAAPLLAAFWVRGEKK